MATEKPPTERPPQQVAQLITDLLPQLKPLDDALCRLDGRRRTVGELMDYRKRTAQVDATVEHIISSPVKRGPLPERYKETEEALLHALPRAWKVKDKNVVSREDFDAVCQTMSRHLARTLPPERAKDKPLMASLGGYLLAEANLLAGIGLNRDQMYSAMKKLSLYEIAELGEGYPKSIVNFALEAADPKEAAQKYMAKYEDVAADVSKTEPDIARSVAASTYYLKDHKGAAAKYVKRYRRVLRHLKGEDPKIAKTIALVAFKLDDPVGTADRYLGNFNDVVGHIRRKAPKTQSGEDIDLARAVAGATFTAEKPAEAADRLLRKYDSAHQHIMPRRPDIAKTIARAAFTADDETAAADRFLESFELVASHMSGVEPELGKTIASRSFMAKDPLAEADRQLAAYKAGKQK